jgi:hypothetical protein
MGTPDDSSKHNNFGMSHILDDHTSGNPRILPMQTDDVQAECDTETFLHFTDEFNPGSGFMSMDLSTELAAIDMMAPFAPAPVDPPMFSFFLERVEPPFIAPYDMLNWTKIRRYIAEMGRNNPVVSAAISCVEALYDSESRGQDTTNAAALYYAAKTSYAKMLEDESQDLETTLVVTFLLCIFEVGAQQETVSIMMKGEGAFVNRLESWVQQRPWPPVASRIEVWLKLLHGKAFHLGGRGLVSARVNQLLSHDTIPTPSLSHLDYSFDAGEIIYDSLAGPLFEFYVQTQRIGINICGLNRHHRPRGSPEDEIEADRRAQRIRKDLLRVWQQRPSMLRLTRHDLQDRLTDDQADNMAPLIDVCNAAYFIEIADLGRSHGKWLTPTPEALEAMRQVRTIVDNSWNHSHVVNPGFMWPIFMVGLEADGDGGSWAVQRLRQISNPICRSSFAADLLEGVLGEQRKKGQRVDCRYFCYETFGVSPPFI